MYCNIVNVPNNLFLKCVYRQFLMTQPVQTVLYYMYMCCSIKMVAFRNVCVALKKGRIVLLTATACILLAAVVRNI